MTDSGNNDTSVAGKLGAVRGVPGDGESPMRTVRFRSSAESPLHRGKEEKVRCLSKTTRDGDG